MNLLRNIAKFNYDNIFFEAAKIRDNNFDLSCIS